MPTQEEVQVQQELLEKYRKNVRQYLLQRASIGESYVPLAITNGLEEQRRHIARIKKVLRGWGVTVTDHPDDLERTTTFYTNTLARSSSTPSSSGKTTTANSSTGSQSSIDIWKIVFDDITHTRLIYQQNYLTKWIVLTSIGFGISLIFSFGLYFSTGSRAPTAIIPNPLERLFLLISITPSIVCGAFQYAYIVKISRWLWVWIPINLILISLLKGFTTWPFGFTPEMLLGYMPLIYLFQISLGFIFKGIVVLTKYINS